MSEKIYLDRAYVLGCLKAVCNERLFDALAPGIRSIVHADVAPVVHGHWIVEDLSVLETYTCSVCEHTTAYFGVKFCPNCGAKMDEEVSDEKETKA